MRSGRAIRFAREHAIVKRNSVSTLSLAPAGSALSFKRTDCNSVEQSTRFDALLPLIGIALAAGIAISSTAWDAEQREQVKASEKAKEIVLEKVLDRGTKDICPGIAAT